MKLQDYRELILSFLDGSTTAEQFAVQYDHIFLSEQEEMDANLFEILEDLFEDVTSYDPSWKLEDENAYRITEKTLRREAIDAIEKLENYIRGHIG